MKELKVLFVGVGSIAKRHIENVCQVTKERGIECHIDAFRTGIGSEVHPKIDECYFDYAKVPENYDIVFITNPTEVHIDTLKHFHEKGKHFFIEKPVCTYSQLYDCTMPKLREKSIYYVASPLRYTKVIQYVKNNINPNAVLAARSISSSYLPDWRPNIDYRKTYSAQKALGGGVAIDLIHEWDYLTYLFGKPKSVQSILKQVSNLEIDTEDIAIYIGEYETKVVELHLDYLGRVPMRKLELFTNDDTIMCDLLNSKISFLKSGSIMEFGQERNDFQLEEIRYFLNLVETNTYENKIPEAMSILGLTRGGNNQ